MGTWDGSHQLKGFSTTWSHQQSRSGELGRVALIYSPNSTSKCGCPWCSHYCKQRFCSPWLCPPPQPPLSLYVALALTGCDITELGKPLPTGEGSSPGQCLCVPQWLTSTQGQGHSGTVWWGRGTEVKKED